MGDWPPIDRDDLKTAATRAGFDTDFPLLIRRLIAETADGLRELDMPGGSGTASGGFDGVVAAERATVEVPAGSSVWELSVTAAAQRKADADYTKRRSGLEGVPDKRVTYVQAILAPWTKGRSWATARTREGRWKKVVALNLDQIHAWLDRAPATTAWLAERIGKAMPGVRAVDQWWSDIWLPSTDPQIGDEIILAGRENEVAQFADLVASGRRVITLEGELSRDGLRGFVAAALRAVPGSAGESIRARALFVEDQQSLGRLVRQRAPLTLVLADPSISVELPGDHPHTIVIAAPPGGKADIAIPRIDSQRASAAFRASGVPADRADQLGALARRSLLATRRSVAVNPAFLTPAWSAAPDAVTRRLLLVGAWNGASPADREVVARCVGREYAEVGEAALRLSQEREAPLVGYLGEDWYLTAPEDAWDLLGPQLRSEDITAFADLAVEVLGERDPLAGLSGTESLKAQIAGQRRQFSRALRSGVARTLVFLGASRDASGAGVAGGRESVAMLVRRLLREANEDPTYGTWMSLGDVLVEIAEAAPDEFLDAMREGLAGAEPLHRAMFTSSSDDDFLGSGSTSHAPFLWALETLAWDPESFDNAVGVLSRLALLDPGGRTSTRPAQSLTEIFSLWHPETLADEEQRFGALRRLLHDSPETGREWLLALIPDGHGFQVAHRKPTFLGNVGEQIITQADLARRVEKVVDLLLEDLGDDVRRYRVLVDKIDDLPAARREEFLQRLSSLATRLASDEDRAELYEVLRKTVAHHREYADAFWALPADELGQMDAAVEALTPQDPVLRVAWMFDSDWVELGDLRRRDDYEAYERELTSRRVEAVGLVLRTGGLPAVERLARRVSFPHTVGMALAGFSDQVDQDVVAWLGDADAEDAGTRSRADAAYAYVAARLRARSDTTLADRWLAETDSAVVQALILRAAPDVQDSWARLSEMPAEVATEYWSRFRYFGLGADFAASLEAAQGLLSVGRFVAALQIVMLYRKHHDTVDAANLLATALEGLLAAGMEDPELRALDQHDFQEIFQMLGRHREALGNQRVLNLEWQLFPALGFEANAPAIHSALAEDPEFFAEMVGYLYKQDDDQAQDGERDPANRQEVARRAYHALHSWRRCPGTQADGRLDPSALKSWILRARERLAADARLGLGESEIGGILAWAPPDDDGMSPPRAVRDVLETVQSEGLDDGLAIGIMNRRGVTSRDLFDGGKQERELASKYREAAAAAMAWPRTRRILRRLADSYEADARREEERAERMRRGLGR